MSKKQKIWLGIFLAMFIIPELLWSPILNTLYELWQSGNVIPFRENFIMASDNLLYFRLVNFMQLVGIVFASVVLFKTSNKKFISWFLLSILILFSFFNLVVFYLSFAFAGVSF